MKSYFLNWKTICFLFVLVGPSGVNAEIPIEVRTLQTWNLPHPYEGPKNLSENVFAYLMHPPVNDYARENSLEISYSKDDDCLVMLGNIDPMKNVEGTFQQLEDYDHPYASLYMATKSTALGNETAIRLPKICAQSGGINPLRLEVEFLPTLLSKWRQSVRYGMKPRSYPTLGDFQFPKTVTGAKGKVIKGELMFSPNNKNRRQPIHVLSYGGMSKEDLRSFLNNPGAQERVYLDVPYRKLLTRTGAVRLEWGIYQTSSNSLKLMCPNYNNPKVKELFNDLEYRRIIQKAADLVYHAGAVGLTDTGLQPVHQSNALAFSSWRQYSSSKLNREKDQLKKQWNAWMTSKGKNNDGKIGGNFKVINGQELIDIKTNDLPVFRLFFADNINDSTYFLNLKEFLGKGKEGLNVINLKIRHDDDFIPVDKFRTILAGDDQLSDGHEGVIFDVPVPYNDHVEHYFSKDQNFFGLDETISKKTVDQAETMLTGDWMEGSTVKLGKILRAEIPCIIIGQHPFYVYTRSQGEHRLVDLPPNVEGKKAPTAYKLARRLAESAVK